RRYFHGAGNDGRRPGGRDPDGAVARDRFVAQPRNCPGHRGAERRHHCSPRGKAEMIWLSETFNGILDFFDAGGNVLWVVLLITIAMWTFIIERLWYFRAVHPGRVKQALERWNSRA